MKKTAIVQDGYRYELTREWGDSTNRVCWIMLNPSIADAERDDATVRRCISFSKGWGKGALSIVNLYAFISTDPKGLRIAADPIGPLNNYFLMKNAAAADLVIAAWGNHADPRRVSDVTYLLNRDIECLGTTKSGAPRHPCRLSRFLMPTIFHRAK